MKKILLSCAVLFLLFNYVTAQLIADAGPDQTQQQCTGAQVILGGTPTASGGTPPYTYLWSPPDMLLDDTVSNPTFSGWGVGTYSKILTVTDFLGNIATDTVLVTIVFNNLAASVSASDTFGCVGNAISFSLNVTGGNPPYIYRWSFGDATLPVTSPNPQHIYNSAGAFGVSVDVWDTYCAVAAFPSPTVHIAQTCGGFSITKQDVLCFNACNGSASVIPAGNYHYLWSNGDTTSTTANLCTGSYAVTVLDSTLAPLDTLSITINQPVQLLVATTVNDVTCFGVSNGAAVLTVSGGTSPYFYSWSGGLIGPVFQGLFAGTYFVTVIDQNQCSATSLVVVNEPSAITASLNATNETLPGACNGSIMLTASGGTVPYSFSWSNAAVGAVITGLCPGNYSVTISDANGCTATATSHVAAACPVNTLVVSISATGDIDCTHNSDTLGSIVSGGTAPYYYWWTNGDTGQSIIASQAGVYDLWVTDSAGCSKTASDTILNLGLVISLQSVNSLVCNGISNGMIKVSVSGGTPAYNYLWSTGALTDSISGIPSGIYTLTVTDASQCTASFSYFLNQVSTNWSYYVYISATNTNCSSNGSATANVQGGTSPLSYFWSTSPPQTTQTATGLAGGHYNVTVTGNDGCIRTGSTYIFTACYNIVQGYVFSDTNGNCTKDPGEVVLGNTSVAANNGINYYYGYSNSSGYYSINVGEAGNFTVSSSPYVYGSCANINVCGSQTISFPGLGDTSVLNFGFSGSAGFNLNVHPGWHSANPGFTKDYWVLYNQTSVPTYTGPATIVFKYDSILVFQNCNNGGVNNAAAHTITWNVSSVPYPTWDWNTVPRANLTVPANTPVGYQLSQEFWITPTSGDCDSSDNHLLVVEAVTGSRDPNEKEVKPSGEIYEEDSILTYTIHFQNTGNDTTWFIVVKDTLSRNLDAATVQNISSSHDYSSFDISDKGILTWVFNPIYLVDSATNEAASKGYIMFRIKKKSNLSLTTEIKNAAHIYFDYNEPVITNTVTNTISSPVSVFNSTANNNISVTAMPNPFNHSTQIVIEGVNNIYDFELFDVTGKTIKKIVGLNDYRFELKRDAMNSGVYFYRITTAFKQRAYGKLMVE